VIGPLELAGAAAVPVDSTDEDRYPVLGEAGRRMLAFLREHPAAPRFRNQSGHRLTPADVAAVRAFADEVARAAVTSAPGVSPPWLDGFVAHAWARVPSLRALGARPARFVDLPTTSRADLARDIAAHVPDDIPTARMINFRTTGTTGHPLLLPSLPAVAASYLAFHQRALARLGIALTHGAGQVGLVLLGHQERCFTYVSVTPTMGESGLVKLNLHPADWRDPDDRARYLDALAPEVLAGDPLSYAELLTLPVTLRPRAALCTAMALHDGLRDAIEARLGCPVLDLYSMNEAGPIAVADRALGGHVLLQPRMHVEILDDDDRPVPDGERGEITLTGGFNPCLPLVRYRTGDFAALDRRGREPMLVGLVGRRPVRFRTTGGAWRNNIDVTHALAPFALAQFALAQEADGGLVLEVPAAALAADGPALVAALRALFGADARVTLSPLAGAPGKRPQYRSALAGAEP
jgi:phenylacetate-CoA ligase